MSPTNSAVAGEHGPRLVAAAESTSANAVCSGRWPGVWSARTRHGAERELPAVVERLVVVLGRGVAVDVDRRAGGRREPAVARDVVGVVVRLEDVLDAHAEVARQPQVLVDVELRVDHGRDARVLVADQVARAAEVVVDELAEDHPPTLRGLQARDSARISGSTSGARSPGRARAPLESRRPRSRGTAAAGAAGAT